MKRVLCGSFVMSVCIGLTCVVTVRAQSRAPLTRGFTKGAVALQSIGAISFGPDGLLAIADPKAAVVYCVDTGDAKANPAKQKTVAGLDAAVGAKLGAPANGVKINDMQANPASGNIYLSVTKVDEQRPVLLRVERDGAVNLVSLDNVSYGKAELAAKEGVRLTNITDLEFARSRVIVAAQATEEFASKVYSIPLPFTHNAKAEVFSTETFHISHNKMETRAPISTLTSYNDGRQDVVVGAFACTPVVKYPVNQLGPDAKVRGTAVIELGSMNRPLDLFFYKKNGAEWLLVSNNNHGVLKVTAAVFKDSERIDEKAPHRKRVAGQFPPMEGIDVIASLQGTLEMSKVNDSEVAVIRLTDGGLTLEVAPLP